MAAGRDGGVFRQLHALFHAGAVGGLTDAQLLERFTSRRGETAELAFAALVERHGAMVLRVCHTALRDRHDAEDAFQATFLVLARRARSIRDGDALASWLHGVARRVAACARAAEARRRTHERRAAERAVPVAGEDPCDDLGEVIHAEVNRLPERYRIPIVLCHLEGLSDFQAAQRLGWPVGTVRSRLARGRSRLRDRLTRRGLAPLPGLLGAGPFAKAARAEVPATLAKGTVQSAMRIAGAGETTIGVASASVADLVESMLRNLMMTRLKTFASTVLVLGAFVGVAAFLPGGGEPRAIAVTAADNPKANAPEGDLETIQGAWIRVSTNGRKVGPDVLEARFVITRLKVDQGITNTPKGATIFLFETRLGDLRNRTYITLDPTKTPKALDFLPIEDARYCPGIYNLEGDTLTIRFHIGEGDRPPDFTSEEEGKPWVLDVYERAKPPGDGPKTAPTTPDGPQADARESGSREQH